MSQRSKNKISTDGASGLGNDAFAGLEMGGLPAGPAKLPARQAKKALKPKSRGRVELRREKAGRGGKTVTTLREFAPQIPLAELDALTFDLKKACACGGTLKGRVIELQGDVCQRVMSELEKRGYRPVRAGG